MNIEIDYNPSPKNTFFISVEINKKEAISFDYTSKGHRIVKQILIEKKPFPKNQKPTAEWDALVIKNKKLTKKYHVKWIDMGKIDWANDEIWEIVWKKPLSQIVKNKLLYYSQLFSDNYKNLKRFSKELKEFEDFLTKEISKYTKIKTIIFDWGGVLIDNPTDELMNYFAKALRVKPKVFKNAFSKKEASFQKGLISKNGLWKNICAELKINLPTAKSLWREAVENVFTDKKEIYRLAKTLKKNGYKLGFLSNTEAPTMQYFLDKGYEKYFDEKIFSCVEKTAKPEEKIYRLALKKLKTLPQETIFIDDREKYIEGAIRIGINGILFKNFSQLKKELTRFGVKIK